MYSANYKIKSGKPLGSLGVVGKKIIISENVWIGAGSIVLSGVTIGDKSVIGAGSVVTKNVPPNQLWAGNPAEFIRKI